MLRLADIAPDGEAFNVVDGVIRARYRHSRTQPSPLAPDQIERYEINLWATSLVFDRGHRIGVVISSSRQPFTCPWSRPPCTGSGLPIRCLYAPAGNRRSGPSSTFTLVESPSTTRASADRPSSCAT